MEEKKILITSISIEEFKKCIEEVVHFQFKEKIGKLDHEEDVLLT